MFYRSRSRQDCGCWFDVIAFYEVTASAVLARLWLRDRLNATRFTFAIVLDRYNSEHWPMCSYRIDLAPEAAIHGRTLQKSHKSPFHQGLNKRENRGIPVMSTGLS
jgi:hypothetical protein